MILPRERKRENPYRAEWTEPSAPSGPKALMKEDMPRSINCEIVSKTNQSIRYVYSEAEGSRCLCASACHSVDGNAFSGNAASRYVVSGETKPLVSKETGSVHLVDPVRPIEGG